MHHEHAPFTPETHPSELPSLDTLTADLLSDEKIAELPIEAQGRTILDRFIGALVRQGNIAGSQKEYTPREILGYMDQIGKDPMAPRMITGTNGLRKAVLALANDIRIGREFGQIQSRLATDDKGNTTLTSGAQIEGYMLAGGRKNYVKNPTGGVHMEGDTWMPVVLEHVSRMAEDPSLEWMTAGKARELMTSSAPLIQNTGRDWEMARHSAERVGVDMDLIGRSAEKIQARTRAGYDMGSTALSATAEGRIGRYRNDLARRSHRY